ncbi:hypothetical protein EDEG_03292 [Edhazardia aedis USNM 41457]|uniref:Uncharacterized protein n=1 Tax=Edhazardia aedis (strain USNM 41457) TaxID=1003232 RepID=J8ZRE4_EDHAE|nr:hypothetical protein EDEG_03292 [Edhazardia aedis USNM 41457]|eukprot:EJW02268.1 hypothetical protein EDEG_03292 [Edhazardia aedis USNM 41457]
MTVLFFRDHPNLEEIYKKNPNYFPLYLNSKITGDLEELRLTKNPGEFLYALNTVEFNNVFECFEDQSNDKNEIKNEVKTPKTSIFGKSKKQTNFASFIKKK